MELVGDDAARRLVPGMGEATDDDFGREFLALKMSVAVVPDLEAAVAHVNRFGTGHTEAIVTDDIAAARRFVGAVDAGTVTVNASTRFTDGEEFGFGAEIGISTQKLHARGPMALRELTTYKYVVWGDGQTRVSIFTQRNPVRTLERRNHHMAERFESVDAVLEALRRVDYLADPSTAGVVFLADRLEKPVLVEGPAGVGKTELAKAIAATTGSRLIRLQCYEGLDESKALYEWNYKKQLLRIQADREHERDWETVESDIFSEQFLLTRPLLEAIRADEPVVLLIDEVDRVEIETEALLLEVLTDFQVSVPELGTITAVRRPIVVLTSNNTRELSEALKRRCLFLHLDYPDAEREQEIVRVRVPEHRRHPGRPDRPGGALHPPARPEEGAVDLGDDRLGPHAASTSASRR